MAYEKAARKPRSSPKEIAGIWAAFVRTRDIRLRNQLVEHYYITVKMIANRIAGGLPRSIDVGDLYSAGTFGLIAAIERFDPARGFRFETYAATRIHGAILDALRDQDWVPRLVRQDAKKYKEAIALLTRQLNREPSTQEVAEHLGVTAEKAELLRREAEIKTVFNLVPEQDEDDEARIGLRGVNVMVDEKGELPMQQLEDIDLARQLTRRLTQTERIVVALYYQSNLSMGEIGTVLGVCESRVCQIHTHLVDKLHALLPGASNGKLKIKAPPPQRPQKIAAPTAEEFIKARWSKELGESLLDRCQALKAILREAGLPLPAQADLYGMVWRYEQDVEFEEDEPR